MTKIKLLKNAVVSGLPFEKGSFVVIEEQAPSTQRGLLRMLEGRRAELVDVPVSEKPAPTAAKVSKTKANRTVE